MVRVVVAMSGGVDSSVAAYLLQRQGHEVVGVFMRHGEKSPAASCATGELAASPELPLAAPRADRKQGCCSAADAADARRVADQLGVRFYALNLEQEFGRIIDYFVAEYTAGRTPNPCVMCNNWLKFGKLFEYADSLGAEFVATGHYARIVSEPAAELPALRCGLDSAKDQSYVLFGVARHRLPRMLLPVGEFRKPQIRELAANLGLRVADKADSQEICFVPSGKHGEFIRQRRSLDSDASGEIVTTAGQIVGRHLGIEDFTIGQRKGLSVAMGERYYVVRIEPDTRRVIIGRRDELACRELVARDLNWLIPAPLAVFRCLAKIRYNSPRVPATAEPLGDNRWRIVFDEPRFGVAPGQAAVCYDGDRVLGGGWIE